MSAFRENDMSRLGELLELQRAGDRPAILDAFAELCATRPEREPDTILDELWPGFAPLALTHELRDIVLNLAAAGRLARPRAFVHVLETSDDATVEALIALSCRLLDLGLPIVPYVAAVWFELLDRGVDAELEAHIRERTPQLLVAPGGWELVGLLYAATPVGHTWELVGWFDERCARAPMWVLAAFLVGYGGEREVRLAEVQRVASIALTRPPDATLPLVRFHAHLGQLALYDHGPRYVPETDPASLPHPAWPLLEFVAACRARHAIPLSALEGKNPSRGGPSFHLIVHARRYADRFNVGSRGVALLDHIARLTSRTPEADQAWAEMRKQQGLLEDVAGFTAALYAVAARHAAR